MVGDTLRDLQAAHHAGCLPHLVRSGRAAALGAEQIQALLAQVPGAQVHNSLSDFVDHLLPGSGGADSVSGAPLR